MYADLGHGQHGTVVSVATQCVLNYIPGFFLGAINLRVILPL